MRKYLTSLDISCLSQTLIKVKLRTFQLRLFTQTMTITPYNAAEVLVSLLQKCKLCKLSVCYTLGPAYNEFGYYEYPAITNNCFLRKEHF